MIRVIKIGRSLYRKKGSLQAPVLRATIKVRFHITGSAMFCNHEQGTFAVACMYLLLLTICDLCNLDIELTKVFGCAVVGGSVERFLK